MSRAPTRHGCRRCRGFALIAVLVVTATALLVATSLMVLAQASVASSAGAADAAQARALAVSGLKVVMSRLNEQRRKILAGELPQLEERYVLYEEGSRLGVVRLLPVGPEGERLVPEAGKLDLNRVDEAMLVATGMIDPAIARGIVTHRKDRGRIQSAGELLEVPGISVETLLGPIDDLVYAFDDEEPAQPLGGGHAFGEGPRGLADVLTVWGVEPAIQQNGRLRINLNVEWSEALGRKVRERFSDEASQMLQQIIESGTTFDSDAKIFEVLRFFGMSPQEWPEIIDAFTTDPGIYHFGRLDINTASYEALLGLPGLEPQQAAEIVQVREALSQEERATIAWPVIRGIVDPEAFDDLAGWITTRSWTYRLRLAVRETDADQSPDHRWGEIILETVIDLSAPRPRVAYLRDITLLPTTAWLALEASHSGELSAQKTGDDEPPAQEDLPADADDQALDENPLDLGDPAMNEPFRSSDAPASDASEDSRPPKSQPETQRRLGRWLGGKKVTG